MIVGNVSAAWQPPPPDSPYFLSLVLIPHPSSESNRYNTLRQHDQYGGDQAKEVRNPVTLRLRFPDPHLQQGK